MADNTPNNNEEVRAKRRTFTVEKKREILAELDAAKTPEAAGLILRRERLHTTLVSKWRREQRQGTLGGRRGVKARDAVEKRNDELMRENTELKDRLALAEELIEAQGKVWALLHEASGKSASQKSPR
jgi:transposase-like protein